MKFWGVICFFSFGLLLGVACTTPSDFTESEQPISDPAQEWAAMAGFAISVDTEGYHFPTDIAFVPEPGPRPQDPLYFVTELRGKIKVVTNDRSIYTFAELPAFRPIQELPHFHAQNGLVGICLAPEQGYIFVTFAYQKNLTLHNSIIRFQSQPHVFGLKPDNQVEFAEIFAEDSTAYAHQIGHCQVLGNTLFVGVGDAWNAKTAQQLDSTNGKILRLSLDGTALPENPFYEDRSINKAVNYVWAYGFRNPFALAYAKNQWFVAENGVAIDRFMRVFEGEDHLWNGSDWSIGTNADALFYPSVGPTDLEYHDGTRMNFPLAYRDKFFMSIFGDATRPAGIVMLDYDFATGKMGRVPTDFLSYRGQVPGIGNPVIGLALGHDGLYFVPLYPGPNGEGAVLKAVFTSADTEQAVLSELDPYAIMNANGCFGCHQLGGEGGNLGPSLDRDALLERIQNRLNSPEYQNALRDLEQVGEEPFITYAQAREEVLAEKGVEQVRLWIMYHLLEPRFDDPNAQMPDLGLTMEEAQVLSSHLLTNRKGSLIDPASLTAFKIRELVDSRLQPLRYRHLLIAFVAGFGFAGFSIAILILRKRVKNTREEQRV